MPRPIAYAVNRLETGIVTVSGALAAKPATRLFDRLIGDEWEDAAATGNRLITVDQGATPLAIGAVLVIGHNLDGESVVAEHDDNAGFASPTTLASATVSGSGIILLSGTSAAERYTRLRINTPASPPRIAELLFSQAIALPFGPSVDGLRFGARGNVAVHESEAGVRFAWRRSAGRWQANYLIRDFVPDDRTALDAWFVAIGEGASPFVLADTEGVLRWVEWLNPEILHEFQSGALDQSDAVFQFREALG